MDEMVLRVYVCNTPRVLTGICYQPPALSWLWKVIEVGVRSRRTWKKVKRNPLCASDTLVCTGLVVAPTPIEAIIGILRARSLGPRPVKLVAVLAPWST